MIRFFIQILISLSVVNLNAQIPSLDQPSRQIVELLVKSGNSQQIEFHNLYPNPTIILNDSIEFLIIANELKSIDFISPIGDEVTGNLAQEL